MGTYWLGVVLDTLPDSLEEGMVLSDRVDLDCQYVVLVRVVAPSRTAAEQFARDSLQQYGPSAVVLLADSPVHVIRSERRLVASLSSGDVSMRRSFVAFQKGHAELRETALNIVRNRILKKWWQFWR